MKKTSKNSQSGFGTIEIVIGVVLLAVIGFLGWRIYTAQQELSDIKNKQNQTEQLKTKNKTAEVNNKPPSAHKNTLDVMQWNVSFTFPDTIPVTDVVYTIAERSSGEFVSFASKKLKDAPYICDGQSSGTFTSIARTTNPSPTDPFDQTVALETKQAGDYYFYFAGGPNGGPCYAGADFELEKTYREASYDIFRSVKAI